MAFAKSGNSKRAWELMEMINPVNHGKSEEAIAIYKVEPYVVAADVYAVAPHIGRGGWTWYSGSAGWMYQLITGSLLGIKQEEGKLIFTPCIPSGWESFKVRYRYKSTSYQISFIQKPGVGETTVLVNGVEEKGNTIALADDGIEHAVEVGIFCGSN
jgi:cellobiose phosphorylase